MIILILILVILMNWTTGVTIESMKLSDEEKKRMKKYSKEQVKRLDSQIKGLKVYTDWYKAKGLKFGVTKEEKDKALKYLDSLEALTKLLSVIELFRKEEGKGKKKKVVPFYTVLTEAIQGKDIKKTKKAMERIKKIEYYRKIIQEINPGKIDN